MRLSSLSALLFTAAAAASGPAHLPTNFIDVPLMRQGTNYSCGPASLLSVLYYNGVFDGREDELYAEMGTTPANGTDPEGVLKAALEHGLEAGIKQWTTLEEVRRALDSGAPVILDIQAWRDNASIDYANDWEDGHYIVAVGMDDHYLYAMDPSTGANYAYLTLEEIEARWHDYEVVNGKRVNFYNLAIFFRPPTHPFRHQLLHID